MTNKIIDFVVLDDEQSPLLNAEGWPTLKQVPIAKDIGQLVDMGKVTHIDKFAALQSESEQYQWAAEYLNYLKEVKAVELENAELEPVTGEDGELIEPTPKPLPDEPVRPEVKTIEEVLEPYGHKIAKLRGVKYKGVDISLTETNQNGLSALKSALDLAKEFGADEQFFPIKFNAETCEGNKVLVLDDESEFKQFGLDFVLARKAFFE